MKGDYRIFVGAFPAGELALRIQAVRLQYDPRTARITPPHVTLAGTYWRSGPPTPHNEDITIKSLQTAAAQIQPFDLLLGGIRSFPPARQPNIYLAAALIQPLLDARRALLNALGPDGHGRFSPHLTLAMRLRGLAAQAMQAALRGSQLDVERFQAPVEELQLMQRGPQDPAWRCIARLELKR